MGDEKPQLVKGLLTIGIPTYNGADNLPGLFASITNLGLSEDDYEVLVVDNGSDDHTDEVIQKYKLQIKHLTYHKNEVNIGRVENWNKVIELAQGEYLIIMNINDRFLEFDAKRYLNLLDMYPQASMVFTDIAYADHIYPNWINEGLIDLESYIRKTFLETEYLEFHSLGVLHQHIFRTDIIRNNNIHFNHKIPRTTDRVFTAEVVQAGGGCLYYTNKAMVSWHLAKGRYHFSVHNSKGFIFDELWGNEYTANMQIADLAHIPHKDMLYSQLVYASFSMYRKKLRTVKDKLLRRKTVETGLEIPTAHVFYSYLITMAQMNKIPVKYFLAKGRGLTRALHWYLRSLGLFKKNKRSLNGIIRPV